jgi:predicted MPP superfamily phosphohydrolase
MLHFASTFTSKLGKIVDQDMRRDERKFYVIVCTAVLVIAGSGVFGAREVFRLTQNRELGLLWALLCLIFQTPFILIPIDRGRTLNFYGKYLPLWFGLVMIAWDLTQLFFLLISPLVLFIPGGSPELKNLPFFILVALLAVVFRSAFRVVEKKIIIRLPFLPEGWEPITILHLSDIHAGPFMRSPHLSRVVDRLNETKFDLCVVTGDVVNHSAKELPWTLSLLEKINSRFGTYAAIGNHEYIDNEKEVISSYKDSKIELLLDSSKSIALDKFKIRLIGVDFPFEKKFTGEDDIRRALSKSGPVEKDELQILLSHHPSGFKVAQTLGIPVTLSGHTHGGQIMLANKNIAGSFNEYLKGLYESGGAFLYVSAGLGNWLPFRINVPCEYALITIEKG